MCRLVKPITSVSPRVLGFILRHNNDRVDGQDQPQLSLDLHDHEQLKLPTTYLVRDGVPSAAHLPSFRLLTSRPSTTFATFEQISPTRERARRFIWPY